MATVPLTITYASGLFTVTPSTLNVDPGDTISITYPEIGVMLCFNPAFEGSNQWKIPPGSPDPYNVHVPWSMLPATYFYDVYLVTGECPDADTIVAIGSHKIVIGSGRAGGGHHHHHHHHHEEK